MSIVTSRLELRPATVELLTAALAGPAALATALDADVPATWPPEFLDDAALQWVVERVAEEPAHAGWWMYFLLRRDDGRPLLVGSAGYKGAPDDTGTVEIGYGIVADQRRRGLASEAALGLLRHVFAVPAVRRVIAETLPELEGSIAVLRRCGFRQIAGASEEGVIRFEITREEFAGGAVLRS